MRAFIPWRHAGVVLAVIYSAPPYTIRVLKQQRARLRIMIQSMEITGNGIS
jgi:hypothetical protein